MMSAWPTFHSTGIWFALRFEVCVFRTAETFYILYQLYIYVKYMYIFCNHVLCAPNIEGLEHCGLFNVYKPVCNTVRFSRRLHTLLPWTHLPLKIPAPSAHRCHATASCCLQTYWDKPVARMDEQSTEEVSLFVLVSDLTFYFLISVIHSKPYIWIWSVEGFS